MTKSDIGKSIAKARKAAGFSQVELAEKLGVPQQHVSKWETISAGISTENLVKICDILSISSDELLGLKEMVAIPEAGKVRRTFEAVAQLPKKQQDKILDVVQAFVDQKAE